MQNGHCRYIQIIHVLVSCLSIHVLSCLPLYHFSHPADMFSIPGASKLDSYFQIWSGKWVPAYCCMVALKSIHDLPLFESIVLLERTSLTNCMPVVRKRRLGCKFNFFIGLYENPIERVCSRLLSSCWSCFIRCVPVLSPGVGQTAYLSTPSYITAARTSPTVTAGPAGFAVAAGQTPTGAATAILDVYGATSGIGAGYMQQVTSPQSLAFTVSGADC